MKIGTKLFKYTLLLLALSMIPVMPAEAATRQVKAYSEQSEAISVSEDIGVMGMRVKISVPVTGVAFCMPTWSVSGKYSAYITAYEWKGSYADTVASEPFATKQFTELGDNATNWLYFEKRPAGEYFFAIEKVSGTVVNSTCDGRYLTATMKVKFHQIFSLQSNERG